MYLNPRTKAGKRDYFRVPHQELPMTAAEIRKQFRSFAEEMDGRSADACLDFFYKRDKDTGIYEFIDADAEEEIAEILGVKIIEVREDDNGEVEGEGEEGKELNATQLSMHHENIRMIREGLAALDSDSSDSE